MADRFWKQPLPAPKSCANRDCRCRRIPRARLPSCRTVFYLRRCCRAGKLCSLELDQWSDAFGICGSQSSGTVEYLPDGTWTKRMHPGWAAHGGVRAALLAREGFRGPEKFLKTPTSFSSLSVGRLNTKFRANESLRLPPERVVQTIEAGARLEKLPSVTSLTDLLKP